MGRGGWFGLIGMRRLVLPTEGGGVEGVSYSLRKGGDVDERDDMLIETKALEEVSQCTVPCSASSSVNDCCYYELSFPYAERSLFCCMVRPFV